MSLFWSLAAVLVVLCMAWLLRPLLRGTPQAHGGEALPTGAVYRDQLRELDVDLRHGTLDPAQRGAAQDELGRRLLDDRVAVPVATRLRVDDPGTRAVRLAAILLAAVPSAAIMLYLHLGNPLSLWRAGDIAQGPDARHELTNAQVEALVNQLAQRLRAEPDDAQGWYMLGRSYAALERPNDAAVAYAKAVALVPDEAMLRADYADVLASVDGGSLQGAAKAQIDRALALDPDQPKALALAANSAMQRGDKAQAVAYWEHLYRLLPPQSQTAARVAANLAEARGGKAASSDAPASASVTGRVTLADGAPRRPGPEETVFVYARAVDGSRLPLAVLRRQVRDLPLAFRLDDSLAMSQDHRLSGQQKVSLEARISASGNATPQAGDLVGRAGPVAVNSTDVVIVIDSMKE